MSYRWLIPDFILELLNWRYCQICFNVIVNDIDVKKGFKLKNEESGEDVDGIRKSWLGIMYLFIKIPNELIDNTKALDAYLNQRLQLLNQVMIEMNMLGSARLTRHFVSVNENDNFIFLKFIPNMKLWSFVKFVTLLSVIAVSVAYITQ